MAQGIVAEAERVFWEELLWIAKKEDRLSVELATIQDDVTVAQRGVSFLPPSRLQAGRKWMLERLASVPAARKLYQPPQQQPQQPQQPQQQHASSVLQPGAVQWRARAVRQYVRRIDRFLELLCLAVHIVGG